MHRNFRFIDLFAGLGGFHLAAESLGGNCVFASEIDEPLRGIYESNFGLLPAGDINAVELDAVPSHDLLCAGFPCQPFSKAGSQRGWKDAVRGTVFFRVVELLERHQPEFLILENVAHFVRHDGGNTYQKVIEALNSLGYQVESKQLSPHEFGVPQIRERMYLVGRLRSKGGLSAFAWPTPEVHQLDIQSVLDSKPMDAKPLPSYVIECMNVWQDFLRIIPSSAKLPSFPIWSMEFGANYPIAYDSLKKLKVRELTTFKGVFGRQLTGRTYKEVFEQLPSYATKDKTSFPHWKQQFILQNREFYAEHKRALKAWLPTIQKFPASLQKLEWNCQGEERDIWRYVIQFRASGVRVKRRNTSPSLVAMTTTQVPIIAWERRYMTPRECARLQSMDKLNVLPPTEGAAFSALGNAVNVTVVSRVLSNLLNVQQAKIQWAAA